MVKDKLGNALSVGDTVAYAVLTYQRAYLRTGIILDFRGDGRAQILGAHDGARRWYDPAYVVLTRNPEAMAGAESATYLSSPGGTVVI